MKINVIFMSGPNNVKTILNLLPYNSHHIVLNIRTGLCMCVLHSPSVVGNEHIKTVSFTKPQMETFMGVRSNDHENQTFGPQYPVSCL